MSENTATNYCQIETLCIEPFENSKINLYDKEKNKAFININFDNNILKVSSCGGIFNIKSNDIYEYMKLNCKFNISNNRNIFEVHEIICDNLVCNYGVTNVFIDCSYDISGSINKIYLRNKI